ncbi:MAG: TonB family protein [Xanthobacteraceae bacterium]
MSDLHQPRHLSPQLLSVAGIIAVALHAGGIGLAVVSMQPDGDPDLGAPAIEIGIELAAPRTDPSNLPVGPDTEAATPSPAVVEQKTVIEHSDLPKAAPTETDDPDRVVAPNDTQKPKEEEPKVPTVQAQASTESVAAEATATPTLQDAPEATHSIAPSPGTGESARRERATWQKELAAHFNKFKRYPAERKTSHAEVVVSFALDRLGHVVSKRIVKGSGDAAFDAAALDMLQRSDPVPPPPPLVADEGLTFSLPVIFQAKDAAGARAAAQSPK